jgi:hypothetical protein
MNIQVVNVFKALTVTQMNVLRAANVFKALLTWINVFKAAESVVRVRVNVRVRVRVVSSRHYGETDESSGRRMSSKCCCDTRKCLQGGECLQGTAVTRMTDCLQGRESLQGTAVTLNGEPASVCEYVGGFWLW